MVIIVDGNNNQKQYQHISNHWARWAWLVPQYLGNITQGSGLGVVVVVRCCSCCCVCRGGGSIC